MKCNCNDNTIKEVKIKHVQGNVLRIAIPLTLRTVELVEVEIDGQMKPQVQYTDTDFIPSANYPVKVLFSKAGKPMTFNAEMDGNIAIVEDKGKLPVGTYDISVECRDDSGNPYRFKQNASVRVVDATAEAGIEEEIEYEATTWYLNAAVFLATTTLSGIDIDIENKLRDVFGDVDYDASTNRIRFYDKNRTQVIATLDASPFSTDSGVEDVYINVDRQILTVKLNADGGSRIFNVPLYLIFQNYYTKSQINSMFSNIEGYAQLDNYISRVKYGQATKVVLDFIEDIGEIHEMGYDTLYGTSNGHIKYVDETSVSRDLGLASGLVFYDKNSEALYVYNGEWVDVSSGSGGGTLTQEQADWNETDTSDPAYIKNKPTIPVVPTNVSSFTNDAGYLTQHQDISGKADKSEMSVVAGTGANADKTTIQLKSGTSATVLTQHQDISGKADKSTTYTKSEVDAAVASAQGTQGPKGDTGNVEITDAGDLVTILVNDLDTGGAGNLLSAEMGKRLALKSGTFAQAWARSKAIPFPFCFLWNETINGDAISKPIWHKGNSVFVDAAGAIVSVEAASVPAAPTITGATSGDTVPKNTQITITPASGSALYYSLDGGTTYNVSDVAVTITLGSAGSVSIVAYCANNKGNSSNTTLSVTVAGTAVPTFSPDGGEVSRGGSVTISVPTGGELHYKVDSGSWTTASGTSVSIPITGATTIQAYNVQDGETSNTITKSFTLAALAAPTFSVSTGTEFPIGGGSVELTGPAGATIYYTTNGDTPTTSSTQYTGAIAVTSSMTIKAIAHDNTYGDDSAVATAEYTVPVDHKFQFKIKLTGNNSTEYVPVIAGTRYTMSVDWGDGSSVQSFDNAIIGIKGCAHQYTGSAGDEKTITIRGSKIPVLGFCDSDLCNISALVEVIENTLECETQFRNSATTTGGFSDCSGLAQISADALSNNTYTQASFKNTAITSLPDGLLSHLTKSGVALTSCSQMFYGTSIVLTADQLDELKAVIGSVTLFNTVFYNFQGTAALPDDFFDLVAAGSVTKCNNMTASAGSGLTGDAKALYDVLATKVTGSATTTGCFGGGNFENVSQVPSGWK